MQFNFNDQFIDEYKRSPDIADVMQEAIGDVFDEWEAIAPRRTGRMVGTTYTTLNLESEGWVAYMMVPVFYAKFVEWGTRYMRAQYNLRHSMERAFGA